MEDSLSIDYIKTDNTKIPIPSPDFLKQGLPKQKSSIEQKDFKKHERAYDAFCRWIALPDDERNPKTITAFEKKWKLPAKYAAYFRQREDFQERRLKYFWEWMMDKFPDVVQSIYKGSMKGNAAQSKTFVELVAKHINIEKPQQTIQPFMLIGVPQEKIEQLFVPVGYEKPEVIIPAPEEEKGGEK